MFCWWNYNHIHTHTLTLLTLWYLNLSHVILRCENGVRLLSRSRYTSQWSSPWQQLLHWLSCVIYMWPRIHTEWSGANCLRAKSSVESRSSQLWWWESFLLALLMKTLLIVGWSPLYPISEVLFDYVKEGILLRLKLYFRTQMQITETGSSELKISSTNCAGGWCGWNDGGCRQAGRRGGLSGASVEEPRWAKGRAELDATI